jgi:endonuclease/exonuclease/phosphatase family metal-dependent hydrolase
MRKGLTAAIFALLTIFSASAAPIKVVCWNLQWFPGGKPKASQSAKKSHMKAAQEALKVLNPDILCLQEVKDWKAVEELISVVPGLRVDVVSRFKGDQQQAVVSKLVPDSSWSDSWASGSDADLPRGYALAALKMPSGGFLLVYSLHLKANGGGDDAGNIAKREESARQLLEHAIAMQKVYGARGSVGVLLTGDFNTTLDPDPRFDAEKTIRNFLASGFKTAWEGVPFEQRVTHPGSGNWPSITFDHVLTHGVKASPGTVEVVSGVSDHMPVVLYIDSLQDAGAIAVALPTPELQTADPAAREQKPAEPATKIQVEEGLPGIPVREIEITPPKIVDPVPGAPKPAPAQ